MAFDLYKPDHPRYPRVWIGDGLPENVKAVLVDLYVSRGYTGVKPDGGEIPYCNSSEIMNEWKTAGKPVVVLSPTKFLGNLANLGLAMKFLRKVRGDSTLLDWWIDDRTLVVGDSRYDDIMRLLNVSREDFRSHCLAGMTSDGK